MRISHSFLQAFMDCPLKGRFRYIDHLPSQQSGRATWGTCVHYALAHYNRTGNVEEAKDLFLDVWKNPEKIEAHLVPQYWPRGSTYKGLKVKGVEMLQNYHDRVSWEKRDVLGIEHKFVVPFGEHQLSGVIDLLALRNSAKGEQILSVEDYKTRSTKPSAAELAANLQFTLYDYATRQPEFWSGTTDSAGQPDGQPIENGEWWSAMLVDTPRRPVWQHLWGGIEVDCGARDESDFLRAYRAVCEIVKTVEAQIFVPCISASSCGNCDYVGPCGLHIPTPEELRERDNNWI